MKPILVLAALLAIAACGDRKSCDGCNRASHMNAANEAEKSFDKDNPADPAAMQAAPAK